jgi:hypothetical protein
MLYFCPIKVNIKLYFMGKKSLQLQQLNNKMWHFSTLKQVATPPTGWINTYSTESEPPIPTQSEPLSFRFLE